jgi:hypothetical protein
MFGCFFRVCLTTCFLLAISGCHFFGSKDRVHALKGVSVMHAKSSEQFSYIKDHKDLARFCAETDTDTQTTKSSGFSVGAKDDSIADDKSSGAVTLGGRDPTVLITRELMFRACELVLNTNAEAPEAVKIYAATLKALLKIIKAHKGVGTVSISSDEGTKNNSGGAKIE